MVWEYLWAITRMIGYWYSSYRPSECAVRGEGLECEARRSRRDTTQKLLGTIAKDWYVCMCVHVVSITIRLVRTFQPQTRF